VFKFILIKIQPIKATRLWLLCWTEGDRILYCEVNTWNRRGEEIFFFIYHFCWLSYLSKLAECWGSFAFIGFLQTFKVMHVGLRIFDNLRIISTFRVRLGNRDWLIISLSAERSWCSLLFFTTLHQKFTRDCWLDVPRPVTTLALFYFFVFDKTITFGCISSPVQILWHCLRCFPLHGTMMLLFHLTQ
jgi:hypothetical protein